MFRTQKGWSFRATISWIMGEGRGERSEKEEEEEEEKGKNLEDKELFLKRR